MDMAAENPFADLMNKAVKLKGAQQAQLRTQYDAWPQYFQHSLFMQTSVATARALAFRERIAAAEAMKASGNAHYSSGDLDEAVAEYEKALAVFKYIENTDAGWKNKGIEDKDLVVHDYVCDDGADASSDQTRLTALKVSCYLNIAVAKFKLKEYAVCIRACDDTLLLDPTNVKAYYRRAQALITPASSGALEFDQAIADLEKAFNVDSSNKDVRKLLRELKEQRARQKKLDRETFSGMFDRGQVYHEDAAPAGSVDDVDDDAFRERKFNREMNEAEALLRMCESKGQVEHAKEIRTKIEQAKMARSRRLKQVDFFHPTEAMLEDARKNGIDLTDPSVQQMLHDLQEKERTKPHRGDDVSEMDSPVDGDDLNAPTHSIDALLASMSNAQIAQLLAREGIDYHKITEREQFLETARQVLEAKISSDTSGDRPAKSYYVPILLMAAAWTLMRLYTTGGLAFLYRLVTGGITDGAKSLSSSSGGNSAAADIDEFFGE